MQKLHGAAPSTETTSDEVAGTLAALDMLILSQFPSANVQSHLVDGQLGKQAKIDLHSPNLAQISSKAVLTTPMSRTASQRQVKNSKDSHKP